LILLYVKTTKKKAAISRNRSPCLAGGLLYNFYGYFCIWSSDRPL